MTQGDVYEHDTEQTLDLMADEIARLNELVAHLTTSRDAALSDAARWQRRYEEAQHDAETLANALQHNTDHS